MPTNIEIKAIVRDEARQRKLAEFLSTAPMETMSQLDTFFIVPKGRLKLREIRPDFGYLVRYNRADIAGPKPSDYQLFPTDKPRLLREILSQSLGILGEVRKRRTVYHAGQTRIHFDHVEGLGDYLELEVVLAPNQSAEQGQAIARQIMTKLQIHEQDLRDGAYLDLLAKR